MFQAVDFNTNNGYLEGVVRGFWGSLLTNANYQSLARCDTLEDMRLQLLTTEYGTLLQSDSDKPISISEFTLSARTRLIDNYNYLVMHADPDLKKFLDYIRYFYVIDNIMLILLGSFHRADTSELLEKCHPLGIFDSIAALNVAGNSEELYNLILIDSPIAPYFKSCVTAQDFDDVNIEIIRNTLYKAYYEDFYKYCGTLGEPTRSIMKNILEFESDRRIISLTINSLNTDLNSEEKFKMYPNCGTLYPSHAQSLCVARDIEEIKMILNDSGRYPFFSKFESADKSFEDVFFEYEVELNRKSFFTQFHYSVFYSYLKLMEQEIRNITWISECIAQKQRHKINNYIPLFDR